MYSVSEVAGGVGGVSEHEPRPMGALAVPRQRLDLTPFCNDTEASSVSAKSISKVIVR